MNSEMKYVTKLQKKWDTILSHYKRKLFERNDVFDSFPIRFGKSFMSLLPTSCNSSLFSTEKQESTACIHKTSLKI